MENTLDQNGYGGAILVDLYKSFNRSSRPKVFCKKVVLENFTIGLQRYQKRDSRTGVFL